MADVVKYGIQIPNRVFVGGVAFDTKEEDLKQFFSQYGKIKECKIIKDNQQISRGFAFVTFESKSDAILTQNLGTVYYNSKKLNLGPAIRQKGVVFNGAKEVENEPVLSTGVYIHPSGYSYTVAPNGVWYFHNPDGTPPTSTPGSPPLAYTPDIVEKTQLHARRSVSRSTGSCDSPPPDDPETNQPLAYHSIFPVGPNEVSTRFIATNSAYQQVSYYGNQAQVVQGPTYVTPGLSYPTRTSSIQVSFQNMAAAPAVTNCPQNNTQVHIASIVPQNSVSMNSSSHPMQYARMTEMYVPYYPEQQKMVFNCSSKQISERLPPPCQHQLRHPDCQLISQVPDMKETCIYPYYQDNTRQHFLYPLPPQQMYITDQQPEIYKCAQLGLNKSDVPSRHTRIPY